MNTNNNKPVKTVVLDQEDIVNFYTTHCIDPIAFNRNAIEIYTHNVQKMRNPFEVTPDEIDKICSEYELFHNKRETLINILKDNIRLLQHLEIPIVDTIVCRKSGKVRQSLLCPNCNKLSFHNKKGLSVHLRKCKPLTTMAIEPNDDENDSLEEEEEES